MPSGGLHIYGQLTSMLWRVQVASMISGGLRGITFMMPVQVASMPFGGLALYSVIFMIRVQAATKCVIGNNCHLWYLHK